RGTVSFQLRRPLSCRAMIDFPIGIKVPVSFADPAVEISPRLIERQTGDLIRGISNRPIGSAPAHAAILTILIASAEISLTDILRRTIVGVAGLIAHQPFVHIETNIEALANRGHESRSEIDAPLQEARRRAHDG